VVKLFSKNSNLCDHNSPTSQTDGQTDRQTTCNRNTALCTKVHRAVTTWARDFKFDTRFCMKVGVAYVTWPLQFLAVRSAILATAWLLVAVFGVCNIVLRLPTHCLFLYTWTMSSILLCGPCRLRHSRLAVSRDVGVCSATGVPRCCHLEAHLFSSGLVGLYHIHWPPTYWCCSSSRANKSGFWMSAVPSDFPTFEDLSAAGNSRQRNFYYLKLLHSLATQLHAFLPPRSTA